jgi:chitinase
MAKHTSSVSKHTNHHSLSKKHTPTTSTNSKHKTTKHKTTKHKATKRSTTNIYGKHRLIAYAVDWEIPSTISWNKFDHVAYAFAEPDANGALKSFTDSVLKKCRLISLCYNTTNHLTALYIDLSCY